MPATIPDGWGRFTENLIPIAKPGLFFRAKPQQSSVYLGDGVGLTAAHNGPPVDAFDIRHVQSPIQSDRPNADLLLYRIESPPDAPSLEIASTTPLPGDPLVHAGLGRHRAPPARFAPGLYRCPCTPQESISVPGSFCSPLFTFEALPFASEVPIVECNDGDSGGMVLGWDSRNRTWQLVGILAYRSFEAVSVPERPRVITCAIDITHPAIREQIMNYIAHAPSVRG